MTMLKVVGVDMLSCGRFEAQDNEDKLIIHEDESAKTCMKFVIRDRCLQGYSAMLPAQLAPQSETTATSPLFWTACALVTWTHLPRPAEPGETSASDRCCR